MTTVEAEGFRAAIRRRIPLLDDGEGEIEAMLRVIVGAIDADALFIAARTEVIGRAMLALADDIRKLPDVYDNIGEVSERSAACLNGHSDDCERHNYEKHPNTLWCQAQRPCKDLNHEADFASL